MSRPGSLGAEVELASHEALAERSRAVGERLAAFAERHAGDPVAWCSLPRLASLAHFRMSHPHAVPSPPPAAELRALRDSQLEPAKLRSPGGTGALLGAGCVFMASEANMRRSQAPLREHFGPVARPAGEVDTDERRARELADGALELAAELIGWAAAEGLELPIDGRALCLRMLRSARLVCYWEALVAREAPRVAIVGSVGAPRARALVLAARTAGVPSVYVPHTAQVAHNVAFSALPVDYAALRGPREAEFLAEQGVEAARLDVVGNPTLNAQAPPEVDPARPPVFAAGLDDEARLGPLAAVVEAALGDDVAVGRHPASDPQQTRRRLPAGWQIAPQRTYELLLQGPPVVLQHSSGVALEALHLGLAVVELHHPGRAPLYPLIREPYVSFASTAGALRDCVEAARARAGEGRARDELVGWAREWADPTGDEAGRRLVALVERAADEGPRGWIWDPWGRV